jgi:hypothetical protein
MAGVRYDAKTLTPFHQLSRCPARRQTVRRRSTRFRKVAVRGDPDPCTQRRTQACRPLCPSPRDGHLGGHLRALAGQRAGALTPELMQYAITMGVQFASYALGHEQGNLDTLLNNYVGLTATFPAVGVRLGEIPGTQTGPLVEVCACA